MSREADLSPGAQDRRRRSTGSTTLTTLARLARVGCHVAQVERAVVLLRDPGAPAEAIVAAVHGLPEETLGRRVVAGDAIPREALEAREPAVLERVPELADGEAHRSGAVVPIRRGRDEFGILVLATRRRLRRIGEEELAGLGELAALTASALAQADAREVVDSAMLAGADALARAVDMRDAYTARHSSHVVELARTVGERLGLAREALVELELASRLHDIGKIGVPDAILRKPGPLDLDEWSIMRLHPVWGARVLDDVPRLGGIAAIVRAHHERWDGSGYPDGLRAEEIPLASRVIAACDAFHAMIADRPYRAALDVDIALRELERGAGTQFDPAVVETLRTAVAELERPPA
jgi:HD-GYP domain-containing protein (c-di-GMP phosphodiesterase class II)